MGSELFWRPGRKYYDHKRSIYEKLRKISKKEDFFPAEGFNIVYGENESGKTTLYKPFFREFFIGIPRKRGTASKTDTYTRCPSLVKSFLVRKEACFLRREGKTSVWREISTAVPGRQNCTCVTDGEKMSVEEGDLEILLGGATQRIYENTAAIGQLKSRTPGGTPGRAGGIPGEFPDRGRFSPGSPGSPQPPQRTEKRMGKGGKRSPE